MRWASVVNSAGLAGGVSCKARPIASTRAATVRLVCALDLDQQRRRVPAERSQKIRHARLAGDRGEARTVDQFDGRDRLALEARHRPAGGHQRVEEQQRAGLVPIVRNGAVGDLGDEAERALRADHQMLKDLERILEIDQRVERIAHRVLDREFAPYAVCERFVAPRLAAKRGEPCHEIGVRGREGCAALGVARVEHGAVGEHDPHRLQRLIGILRRAAAHARGVVGGNAADHRRRRSRRGPDRSCARRAQSRRLASAPMTPGCDRYRGAVVGRSWSRAILRRARQGRCR